MTTTDTRAADSDLIQAELPTESTGHSPTSASRDPHSFVTPEVWERQIQLLVRDHPFDTVMAERLFGQAVAYLITAIEKQGQKLEIGCGPLVDTAVHGFILDTANYRAFCQQHLGWFLDHIPAIKFKYDGSVERTAHWQRAGAWQRFITGLQAQADAAGLIGWDVSVDSTIARAHQHAAGARRRPDRQSEPPGGLGREPADHALGRSCGGWTTKVPLACEQGQKPMSVVLTGGQRADSPQSGTSVRIKIVARQPPETIGGQISRH